MTMSKSYINYNQRAVIEPQTTDDNKRSVEGILTTETPVTVFDFYRWDFINEVLMLDGMKRVGKIPLIDAHDRSTSKNVIGSTTDFKIINLEDGTRAVKVTNIFSKVENDLYEKVREGHIDSTSVGYRVNEDDSITIKPGKRAEYQGREWINKDTAKDLVIRKSWTPMENSLVPIGADQKSKFRAENKEINNGTLDNYIKQELQNAIDKEAERIYITGNGEATKQGIITDTEIKIDTKGVNRMQMNENIFKRLK